MHYHISAKMAVGTVDHDQFVFEILFELLQPHQILAVVEYVAS